MDETAQAKTWQGKFLSSSVLGLSPAEWFLFSVGLGSYWAYVIHSLLEGYTLEQVVLVSPTDPCYLNHLSRLVQLFLGNCSAPLNDCVASL